MNHMIENLLFKIIKAKLKLQTVAKDNTQELCPEDLMFSIIIKFQIFQLLVDRHMVQIFHLI